MAAFFLLGAHSSMTTAKAHHHTSDKNDGADDASVSVFTEIFQAAYLRRFFSDERGQVDAGQPRVPPHELLLLTKTHKPIVCYLTWLHSKSDDDSGCDETLLRFFGDTPSIRRRITRTIRSIQSGMYLDFTNRACRGSNQAEILAELEFERKFGELLPGEGNGWAALRRISRTNRSIQSDASATNSACKEPYQAETPAKIENEIDREFSGLLRREDHEWAEDAQSPAVYEITMGNHGLSAREREVCKVMWPLIRIVRQLRTGERDVNPEPADSGDFHCAAAFIYARRTITHRVSSKFILDKIVDANPLEEVNYFVWSFDWQGYRNNYSDAWQELANLGDVEGIKHTLRGC